ncbi:MAG: hypothetical protein JSR68_08340 [Proteobacteria bacterium]|nr:hypothetical protein [Pseudomonadota bacterium]
MPLDTEESMLLGRIDGKLDGITAHLGRQDQRLDVLDKRVNERLDGMDARLRDVEKRAAVAGAFSGTAVSVGMALIIEGVKQWLRGGGGGGPLGGP